MLYRSAAISAELLESQTGLGYSFYILLIIEEQSTQAKYCIEGLDACFEIMRSSGNIQNFIDTNKLEQSSYD